MDTTEQNPVARLTVPATGGGGCAVAGFAFVGFFIALAVNHLIHFSETPLIGLISAVLWLVLVALMLWGGIQATRGLRGAGILLLGLFSSRQFVEAARDGDRVVIGFGYQLFGRRFYYLRVERERIVSIDMRTGQATSHAGHDMDDWHVTLWYRNPERNPPRKRMTGIREDEVYVVGPSCARAITGEFFAGFVAFLRTAGVELHPTANENEFRTSAP